MRIAGIIAEYNPFHNGHAWHVRQTRCLSGCNYVIACMAGHFTQRGEAACASKWARTRMALLCGVDAVFELPAMFAVRPADAFAWGGVCILGGLGADVLSFGAETDDMDRIRALATLKGSEPKGFSGLVREKLDAGLSHARAWGEAAGEYLDLPYEALNQPNLVLAAEYIRSIEAGGFNMVPMAVLRRGDYHSDSLDKFASASAIRAAFERGETQAALEAIPEIARPFAMPDAMHPMDDLLLYRLRGMTIEALSSLPYIGEGLEYRLYRRCRDTWSRESLLEALKCKRYTRARLSRLLTHALLEVDTNLLRACPRPTYARLLGARNDAGPLLTELSRRSSIPIVSSATELHGDPCFELEFKATQIWSLLHNRPDERTGGREYLEKFVRVE